MKWRLFIYALLLSIGGFGASNATRPSESPPPPSPRDFLTDERYSRLVIEVATVASGYPTPAVIDYARQKLLDYCHKKSVEVVIRKPEPPIFATPVWSYGWLIQYLDEHATLRTTGDMAVMHIAYVDGAYLDMANGTMSDAGLAISTNTAVIFISRIAGVNEERSVLLHEIGHLLGLVNNGTPQLVPRQDARHARHCDRNCVMFWCISEYDSTVATPDFDDRCRAELKANGGR